MSAHLSMVDLANALLQQQAEVATATSEYLNRPLHRSAPAFHPGSQVWLPDEGTSGIVAEVVNWSADSGWTYRVQTDAGYSATYREDGLKAEGAS